MTETVKSSSWCKRCVSVSLVQVFPTKEQPLTAGALGQKLARFTLVAELQRSSRKTLRLGNPISHHKRSVDTSLIKNRKVWTPSGTS